MNQNNNLDMGKLMAMLSQMDKNQIQQELLKITQILTKEETEKLINIINKNNNQKM